MNVLMWSLFMKYIWSIYTDSFATADILIGDERLVYANDITVLDKYVSKIFLKV